MSGSNTTTTAMSETVEYFTSTFPPDTKRTDFTQLTKMLLWFNRAKPTDPAAAVASGEEKEKEDEGTGQQSHLPLSVLNNVLKMIPRIPCRCNKRNGTCPLEEITAMEAEQQQTSGSGNNKRQLKSVWDMFKVTNECERQTILRATGVRSIDLRYCINTGGGMAVASKNDFDCVKSILESLKFKPALTKVTLPITIEGLGVFGEEILAILQDTPNVSSIDFSIAVKHSPAQGGDQQQKMRNFFLRLLAMPHLKEFSYSIAVPRSVGGGAAEGEKFDSTTQNNTLFVAEPKTNAGDPFPQDKIYTSTFVAPLTALAVEIEGQSHPRHIIDPDKFVPWVKESLTSLRIESLESASAFTPKDFYQYTTEYFPSLQRIALRVACRSVSGLEWFSCGILGIAPAVLSSGGARVAEAVAASCLPRLQSLNFGAPLNIGAQTFTIGVPAIRALVQYPAATCSLVELNLSRCGLNCEMMVEFTSGIASSDKTTSGQYGACALPALKTLDLSYNNFEVRGVKALVSCRRFFNSESGSRFSPLRRLKVQGNSFGGQAGQEALLDAYQASSNLCEVVVFPGGLDPQRTLFFNRVNKARAAMLLLEDE